MVVHVSREHLFPRESQSRYDLSFPFQEVQREMPHGSGMLGAVS